MQRSGLPPDTGEPPEPSEFGGELEAAIVTRGIRVGAGDRDEIRVMLRNRSAAEIRGEAQVISPHETWPAIAPWTQGFSVAAGEEATVRFAVAPRPTSRGGSYWALIKVMYFGRLIYTESIPVEIIAVARVSAALAGASAGP
jgi:hypothetical protein